MKITFTNKEIKTAKGVIERTANAMIEEVPPMKIESVKRLAYTIEVKENETTIDFNESAVVDALTIIGDVAVQFGMFYNAVKNYFTCEKITSFIKKWVKKDFTLVKSSLQKLGYNVWTMESDDKSIVTVDYDPSSEFIRIYTDEHVEIFKNKYKLELYKENGRVKVMDFSNDDIIKAIKCFNINLI